METILEITNLDRNAATRVHLDTADGELHEERLHCMRAITELQQGTADVFANARLLDPVAGDADMGVLRGRRDQVHELWPQQDLRHDAGVVSHLR